MSGYVEADAVYLSPAALAPSNRAAVEFILTLLSPESQAAFAEGGAIPALSATAAFAPGGLISIKDELIREAMIALEDGVTYPVVPAMAYYSAPLDIALQAIFFDGVPVEEALRTAEESIQAAISGSQSPATQNP